MDLEGPFTLELERAVCGSLILGVEKLTSKAQTIENLTNLQVLDSLRKWSYSK